MVTNVKASYVHNMVVTISDVGRAELMADKTVVFLQMNESMGSNSYYFASKRQ